MGGLGHNLTGALYRGHKGAPCSETIVAIAAAVTEKIEFEKIHLAPSSGETGISRGPMSRVQGEVLEYYKA